MNINILRVDQKPGTRSQERLGWKGQRQRWIRAEGHGHLKGTGCGAAVRRSQGGLPEKEEPESLQVVDLYTMNHYDMMIFQSL